MELPEECWESIFSFLEHHRYFEPLSLVCKRFLSISNHLRRTLTITDPTLESLPNLLLHFQISSPSFSVISKILSELDLSNSFISDELLCLVAEANLPLYKLVLSRCFCFTLMGFIFSCPSTHRSRTWILKEQLFSMMNP
ncbi:hypothetical protein GQ457_09G018910 [Hibiscus cannabinus]